MAIVGATERSAFFDTQDFATASSYPSSGGSISTVNSIFDNEYFKVGQQSVIGVLSAQPRFICITVDLPGSAAASEAITVDGTAYNVRVIQRDRYWHHNFSFGEELAAGINRAGIS